MIKKYGIFGFSALALLAIGCDSGSSTTSGTFESKATVDEQAQMITLKYPSCEEVSATEVRFDPEGGSTEYTYNISNDTLYLTETYFNEITVYTGNNTSIYGSWTSAGLECSQMGLCEKLEVTSTSVKESLDISSDFCAFDALMAEQGGGMTEGMDIVKTDCNSGSANMGGQEMKLNISKFTNSGMEFTISLGSTNCKMKIDAVPLTASLCKVENLENISEGMYMDSNEEEFMTCFMPILMTMFPEDALDFSKRFSSEKLSKILKTK